MGRRRKKDDAGMDLSSFLNIMTATIGVQTLTLVIFALQIKPGVKAVQILPAGGEGKGKSGNYVLCEKNGELDMLIRNEELKLNINDDNIDEYDEQIIIDLIDSTVTNANTGSARKHVLTIIDNDPPPDVEFITSNTSISEANGKHIVILNLSNQSGKEVYVDYQIEISSSAVNGEDYTFQNGTSFFPAGKTRDTLDITLINDTIDEPSQTLILSLLNPKNSTIGMRKSHTIK